MTTDTLRDYRNEELISRPQLVNPTFCEKYAIFPINGIKRPAAMMTTVTRTLTGPMIIEPA